MKSPERQPRRAAPAAYYRTYSPPSLSRTQPPATGPARPPRRAARLAGSAIIVFLLVVGSLSLHALVLHQQRAHASRITAQTLAAARARQTRIAQLPGAINAILQANDQVTFSVSLVDLQTGASQHIGSMAQFDAASTSKLITAAAYLMAVERGTASLTQTIDDSSAQTLLQNMVVVSDDQAWTDLNDSLGNAALARAAAAAGIPDWDMDGNLLKSDDMAQLLRQLYAGHLLNAADTRLLLSWMADANYRDYIVGAVPGNDRVYHKVGLDDDTVNDAAIITDGQRSFVLVIYSDGNGTYDWAARAKTFQSITARAIQAYLG